MFTFISDILLKLMLNVFVLHIMYDQQKNTRKRKRKWMIDYQAGDLCET